MIIKNHLFPFLLLLLSIPALPQAATVDKTNPMPVYMHYMPWFDTPATSGDGKWGWHWTMNNKDPEKIIDPATGKREIAAHFYPLTGPYAVSDPDILEYHLLLMKYAGIDGVLIDWYGTKGSNADIKNLLRNSNAVVEAAEKTGLRFGVVLEDRFATTLEDVTQNIAYLKQHYFRRPGYIRMKDNTAPLVVVFGPITFELPDQWSEILKAAGEDVEFLTLWSESKDAGTNADGEYMWIWEDETQDNYFTHLQRYYNDAAPSLETVMGVAYPGFEDFYKEGNAGDGYFSIPHEHGATLDKTLKLAEQNKANINMLQLATWNDYGEGTMIEPTFETGFEYLKRIQSYTGVTFDQSVLLLILRLYELRKNYKEDEVSTALLDKAHDHLINLKVDEARSLLDSFERTTDLTEHPNGEVKLQIYPNPSSEHELKIKITGKLPSSPLGLSINDVTGRSVHHWQVYNGSTEYTVTTADFKKGMYMIRLHMTDTIIATRLIAVD